MKNTLFLAVVACMLLTSCEDVLVKTLELEDFEFEKQLAISGALISTDDEFALLISQNQAITDPFDQWEPAVEATAVLYSGDTEIGRPVLSENNPEGLNNLFLLDLENIELEPGNYRLEVDHPTLGTAVAESEIPEDIQIDNIEFVEDFGIAPNFLSRSDAILVTFTDPPEDNYYSLKIESDSIISDTFFYGMDTLVYEYEPFLGVDSGEPGAQMIQDGILFTDDFFNGQEHMITLYLAGLEFEEAPEKIIESLHVTWDVISRDKFEFDSSLQLYDNSQGFGPFTEPVTIFNNIEGGVGIFSGLNRSFYPIP